MRMKVRELPPQFRDLMRRAVPSYRRHEIIVHPTTSVTLSGAYWDGGSRSEWFKVDRNGVRTGYPGGHPGYGGPPEKVVTLGQGFLVMEDGVMCGKRATLTFYGTEQDFEACGLPIPKPDAVVS